MQYNFPVYKTVSIKFYWILKQFGATNLLLSSKKFQVFIFPIHFLNVKYFSEYPLKTKKVKASSAET